MPIPRVFPKHPLAFEDPTGQRRAAKAMLANAGKIVGQVWAIDDHSIAYTTTTHQAYTAYIIRDEADSGWMLGELIVSGWPIDPVETA
jgi:hypothetical protein